MSSIKLFSVDISGDKELINVLNEFAQVVTTPKIERTTEIRKRQNQLSDATESILASRLGAKLLRGKLGQAETTDFELTPTSPILKFLVEAAGDREAAARLEFKASTEGDVTIGQITLRSDSTKRLLVPGNQEALDLSTLFESAGISKKGFLLELDPEVQGKTDITDRVFDTYFKVDTNLKKIFFSKARNVVLSVRLQSDSTITNKLVFLNLPETYFTKEFYKATREKNAIVLSLRTSFQNFIRNTLSDAQIKAVEDQKPIKVTFTANSKSYEIDYLPFANTKSIFTYGAEVTASLKARPVDTFFVSIKQPTAKKKETEKARQQFISGVQWTVLTQRRLGETMLRLGDPEPPELKERTGRFRGSVQVFANYKTRLLQYTYNPLYKSLERYGYKPDLQVETAIREVAQSLYAQRFNIVRTNRV